MSSTPNLRARPLDEPCRNCGDATPGRHCASCGQRRSDVAVSLAALFRDVLEDQLMLNPTLPRTLGALFAAPGRLTNEYIRGRVVHYIAPFRLYLAASVIFFIVFSFYGLRALDRIPLGTELSMDADSVRQQLVERRDALLRQDTAGASLAERALTLQFLANTEAALAMLEDSVLQFDVAAHERIVRRARGEAALARGNLQPWAQQIDMSSSTGWIERTMQRKLSEIGHLPPREAIRTVLAQMLAYAPHMVFLLLPLFALLLKLLYIRRDRYYTEHFIFALHVHAFFFMTFLLILLISWSPARWLLTIWMAVYVWMAMKRVYRQGWIRTTAKWAVLGWAYFFLFSFGLIGLTVATLLIA